MDILIEKSLADTVVNLAHEVKDNVERVSHEIQQISNLGRVKDPYPQSSEKDFISSTDLSRIIKETSQLKEILPKVLSKSYIQAPVKLHGLESELMELKKKQQHTEKELVTVKSKVQELASELEKEKQEKFRCECEIQELTQELTYQSEYCTNMGAATCTLLWRVSRSEDSVQSILVGSKTKEFLQMVVSTLESYLQTYQEDIPVENAAETQFVLGLCGIITNVAASAFGREYLMKSDQGSALIDMFLQVLTEAPNQKCSKMKNLILMALYNLSINQIGLKYISSKPDILALLTWLAKESAEVHNKLHSLKLIQSLIYEYENVSILHQAKELVTDNFLQPLANNSSKELRETALELKNDMQGLLCKQ